MEKRIMKFMQYKHLTASQFADILEVQRSGISHLFSGRNKPSLDLVLKMLDKFPEINIHWLLKGEGVMISDNPAKESKDNLPKTQTSDNKQATLFSVADNTKNILKQEPNIPESESVKTTNEALQVETSNPKLLQPIQTKKIERIVMFYGNNTFHEYTPQS